MSGGKSITWCKDKNTFDVFPMLEGYNRDKRRAVIQSPLFSAKSQCQFVDTL